MIPHLVHLEPRLVVDVDVLLLSDGKEGFVVQPSNRSTSFSKMQLRMQSAGLPVERSDVTLLPDDGEMSTTAQGQFLLNATRERRD